MSDQGGFVTKWPKLTIQDDSLSFRVFDSLSLSPGTGLGSLDPRVLLHTSADGTEVVLRVHLPPIVLPNVVGSRGCVPSQGVVTVSSVSSGLYS